LSRTERIELQNLLSAQNYDAGTADGIIGANTLDASGGRIGSGRRLNGAELLGHIGPPYVSWPGAHG
jgi:hypothetical protein